MLCCVYQKHNLLLWEIDLHSGPRVLHFQQLFNYAIHIQCCLCHHCRKADYVIL